MPLKVASDDWLYRGQAGVRYSAPPASDTKTCEPAGAVLVVVATTSIRPSPSRSAAAIPRVSGHWPPLQVEAGQPGLTRNPPAATLYAATVPSLPPTTISLTPSPSRSVTTSGAYTRPAVAVPLPSSRPRAPNTNV